MAFRKKTGPNIREHTFYNTNQVAVVTMDKYLMIKKRLGKVLVTMRKLTNAKH
jgi:hypothetical protein